MTAAIDLLRDAFGRVEDHVLAVLDGITPDELAYRADPEANTVAWLVWHLTRVQDDHLAPLAGREQVWLSGGFAERAGLPFPARATGYGQSPAEAAAVGALGADLLGEYFAAVHRETLAYLDTLVDADLAEIVDADWDPPVTLAVRLVSVVDDDAQHAGQAAYVRGLAERAG